MATKTKNPGYVLDSKLRYCMERVGDAEYKRLDKCREAFEVVKSDGEGLCGNVSAWFTSTGKAKLGSYGDAAIKRMSSEYEYISSALALYRTISMFRCGLDATHPDFYKLNWFIQLRHKETGLMFGLGEWKGGFNIFTPFGNTEQANKHPKYVADVEFLLSTIGRVTMPIGYDGTIAGTVA